MVTGNDEDRIVAAVGSKTMRHFKKIPGAPVFGPAQDPGRDRVGRNDKRPAVGIAIDEVEYGLVRNN